MASGNDMRSSQETYNGFVKVTIWATSISVVTVAIVIAMIS